MFSCAQMNKLLCYVGTAIFYVAVLVGCGVFAYMSFSKHERSRSDTEKDDTPSS